MPGIGSPSRARSLGPSVKVLLSQRATGFGFGFGGERVLVALVFAGANEEERVVALGSIRRLFRVPLNLMSVLVPRLVGFPTEILEHVLLQLPGQDIVKMEAVRRVAPNPVWCAFDIMHYDLGLSTIPGPGP